MITWKDNKFYNYGEPIAEEHSDLTVYDVCEQLLLCPFKLTNHFDDNFATYLKAGRNVPGGFNLVVACRGNYNYYTLSDKKPNDESLPRRASKRAYEKFLNYTQWFMGEKINSYRTRHEGKNLEIILSARTISIKFIIGMLNSPTTAEVFRKQMMFPGFYLYRIGNQYSDANYMMLPIDNDEMVWKTRTQNAVSILNRFGAIDEIKAKYAFEALQEVAI